MGLRTHLACLVLLFVAAFPDGSQAEAAQAVRRIVALAPSVTETLFAMGVGERVVGTTEHSDYPTEAGKLPTVGKYMDPDLERILALRPDACVGLSDSTSAQLVRMLARFGIPTFLADASRLDTMLDSIGKMGVFLGVEEQAVHLQQQYAAQLNSIGGFAKKEKRPRVLTVISTSPLYIAGPNTFIADIVQCAGGEPLGLRGGKQWQGLSREAVISLKPDIILFAAHTGEPPEWMLRFPLDTARVIAIDPSSIMRPSPRLIDTAQRLSWEFRR